MDDNFIKTNKRADKTIKENIKDIKENSFIDCYNNKIINDGTTTTITARINDSNHISATLTTRPDTLGIAVKTNNSTGYIIASGGDGIDLEQPNSSTRRGRVQKQMVQTLNTSDTKGVVLNDLRIRKLTPKECWRLMGFKDSEFEKAQKVNSNAQLYKQAGNSIVVDVLERILENLLLKDENDFEGQMRFF